jgi:hypothetical protein
MIYTFPRAVVEFGLDLVEPYALISISTPKIYGYNERAADFNLDHHEAALPADEFRIDVLRLAFWDMDRLDPQWNDRMQAQARLYSAEDARRVATFVKANKVNLVIHCDAGISRSQGMANAIADHLDVEVKHSVRGTPNSHVYGLTWEALRPRVLPPKLDPKSPALTPSVIVPVTIPTAKRDKYRINFKGGEIDQGK